MLILEFLIWKEYNIMNKRFARISQEHINLKQHCQLNILLRECNKIFKILKLLNQKMLALLFAIIFSFFIILFFYYYY